MRTMWNRTSISAALDDLIRGAVLAGFTGGGGGV